MRTLFFALAMVFALPIAAQNIGGTWEGTLTVPGARLRLVFHISRNTDGAWTGVMDSPDQGARGIPASSIETKGDSVRIMIQSIGGGYFAKLIDSTMTGTWRQGGSALNLDVRRTSEVALSKPTAHPQEPRPPYPYDVQNVSFENPVATGVTLAGTLTLPQTGGPHPAVVLISGSGPQNRDEELLGHKPFHVLADYLTRRGFAVLRYDDRGYGASTGDFGAATTFDFATDVEAALRYLHSRSDIDTNKLGLIGHSEGGLIAPLVAGRREDVAYVVLIAPPGVTGEEIIIEQLGLIMKAGGATDEVIQATRDQRRTVFEILRTAPPDSVRHRLAMELARQGVPEQAIEPQVLSMMSPWFRSFLTFDPIPTLKSLKMPVLAVMGEKDLQVPPHQNAGPIQAAFEASGNKDAKIVTLPGLNHLMQTATTGSPTEYDRIEETISPAALSAIGDWLQENAR